MCCSLTLATHVTATHLVHPICSQSARATLILKHRPTSPNPSCILLFYSNTSLDNHACLSNLFATQANTHTSKHNATGPAVHISTYGGAVEPLQMTQVSGNGHEVSPMCLRVSTPTGTTHHSPCRPGLSQSCLKMYPPHSSVVRPCAQLCLGLRVRANPNESRAVHTHAWASTVTPLLYAQRSTPATTTAWQPLAGPAPAAAAAPAASARPPGPPPAAACCQPQHRYTARG